MLAAVVGDEDFSSAMTADKRSYTSSGRGRVTWDHDNLKESGECGL